MAPFFQDNLNIFDRSNLSSVSFLREKSAVTFILGLDLGGEQVLNLKSCMS
jgi:hypothetical protein